MSDLLLVLVIVPFVEVYPQLGSDGLNVRFVHFAPLVPACVI